MMKKSILSVLVLFVGLAGCGQTGALYLPEPSDKAETTKDVSIHGADGSVSVKSDASNGSK